MAYQANESRIYLVLCVLTANLLGFTVGLMLSWTSPVLPKLEKNGDENPLGRSITAEENSWIGSLLNLGAAFGPFLAAYASQKIGRKYTLIGMAIPLIVSFLILAFAESVPLYYFARIFSGLSVGGVFTVLPTYIAEISEDRNRGTLGATLNIFVVTGVLISYIIGPYISILWFCIFCVVFPCIFMTIFFIFMPETPQYLIKNGRLDDARESLRKLRSDGNFSNEFDNIKNEIDQSSIAPFSAIYKTKSNRKGITISVALASFQQFSGINVIQFYAQQIFLDAGSSISPEISPMIIGGVQVLASFVTPLAVDRLGRRILFLISGAGMFIAEVPLGLFFYLKDDGQNVDAIFWLPILCLIVYIIFYNFGFGPLPWTVMAELFPSNVKPIATSITAFSCWMISFILTKVFSSVADAIGLGGTFWLFSGFNVLAILFTYFYVPETKGKGVLEIQKLLAQ